MIVNRRQLIHFLRQDQNAQASAGQQNSLQTSLNQASMGKTIIKPGPIGLIGAGRSKPALVPLRIFVFEQPPSELR